VESVEPSV